MHGTPESLGMRLAVMQPYLFPYVGYFQLIHAVDTFVLFDDVNYIVRGWINRNRILAGGGEKIFTLPLAGATRNRRIDSLEISREEYPKWRDKFLTTLHHSYSKAPCYERCMALIGKVLAQEERNVNLFLEYSLLTLCDFLGIPTRLQLSSGLAGAEPRQSLKGEDRIVAIARHLGARHYLNAIGGVDLYSARTFADHGLSLSFVKSKKRAYPQFAREFVPWLSIIDLIMFNQPEQLDELLTAYDVLPAAMMDTNQGGRGGQ